MRIPHGGHPGTPVVLSLKGKSIDQSTAWCTDSPAPFPVAAAAPRPAPVPLPIPAAAAAAPHGGSCWVGRAMWAPFPLCVVCVADVSRLIVACMSVALLPLPLSHLDTQSINRSNKANRTMRCIEGRGLRFLPLRRVDRYRSTKEPHPTLHFSLGRWKGESSSPSFRRGQASTHAVQAPTAHYKQGNRDCRSIPA